MSSPVSRADVVVATTDESDDTIATSPGSELAGDRRELKRSQSATERMGNALQRAGSNALQRAGSNLQLQRAGTLPKSDKMLQHAATMPILFDEADRPWCGGLWKTQQLIGFLLGVGSMLVLSLWRPIHSYPQSNDMLGVAALCASFWVCEVIPIYMTALIPMVMLPFLKITSSAGISAAYWNWISMFVLGTFLVDIALEQVHLPRRLALKLLLHLGIVHPAALLAVFMGLCWLLSMVVNSIAVTLLITPFAIGLMNSAEEQVRSLPEEIEGGDAEEQQRQSEGAARDVQKFADGLLLGIAYSATAGGMATLTGAVANYFLAGETNFAAVVSWEKWFMFASPISLVTLLLAYVVLYLRYVRGLKFRGIEREVLESEYEDLLREVGPFSRDEAIAGAIQVLQIAMLILRPFAISPFVTTPSGENMVNDATIACLPALLLFFVPSVVRPGQALLTWPVVHEKFDFGLLLLIGGGMAINSGFTNSGLNIVLGDGIASAIPHVDGCILDFLILVCVTLCAQVFSNIGTAAAMLPILGSAATEAVINPLALLLPATIATSFAFMLPTATPPNVVVLAKSTDLSRALRIRDFFSNGLPLTLGACILGAILTHYLGLAVFDSEGPFPRWACDAAASGNCLFAALPGVVQGRQVDSQACIINLGPISDGSVCRIWNGTVLSVSELTLAN
mmetsp:Transcript_7294/g.26484  ORF Transcript_7294/g.26484 Transcript_7294/m.26484 type:complete len:681 (+) Transcript_7294:97-2139(+)